MSLNKEEKNYYLNEIYNDLNYWKEIIHLGGNLLISFNSSNILSFYEFFQMGFNDTSNLKISKSTFELNIKDDITSISNISRMNDGSILGSINNKIIIIKVKREKGGEYIPEPYLIKNINYNNESDNNIQKVIELTNGKLIICDISNKLNICNYTLNKKENTSKSMVKSFFKKISNSIKSDNILEKISEIPINYRFNKNSTMIMEIIYNNDKLILCQNYEEKILYIYEPKEEIYIKKFEINNINSQYIKQICNGFLIGFNKDSKTKFIELISLHERKIWSKLEINDIEKNPIVDIAINYKKNKNGQYEYFIVLLRKSYLINKIYFNPQENIFKIDMENEFIELKTLNKEWPTRIIEFKKDDDEPQYILISERKIYLMNNKANDYLTFLFFSLLLILLIALIESGSIVDIIFYLIVSGISIKLFFDYKYDPDKNNFLKNRKNKELINSIFGILWLWFFKFIGIFNSFFSILFGGFFGSVFLLFLFLKCLF